MTNERKALEELRRIDAAIDESILRATEQELREELIAEGLDPDKVIAEMDARIKDANLAGAKLRLEIAKTSMELFKSKQLEKPSADKDALRGKLRQMRSGGKATGEGLMMAARKGNQLSQNDEEGILDDLAQLEALEVAGRRGFRGMTSSPTPAERILISLGVTEPADIDLEAVAWDRGAIVNYRQLDGAEATIIGTQRRAVITVNSRSLPERRRFSLGHELGHWHHHRGQLLFCDKRDVANFANDALNPERHADAFASDLILPNYLLDPRLRKWKRVTLALARELADEFCASLTATLFKVTLSNHFPMAIVCHNKVKRHWFERAPMIQPWWFPLRELDRQTFAADMLFSGAAEQNFPRKMPADAWFDFKGADRLEVEEQSFLLPDEQILTVLKLPSAAVA